jgi:hypothetical protein
VGKKDDLMGVVEIRKTDFQFQEKKWYPMVNGEGEVQLGLKFLGATYTNYLDSANPYWREWPIVKKILNKLPNTGASNVLAKLPDYTAASRILYSSVVFFQDVHNVLPRPAKKGRSTTAKTTSEK